MILLHAGSPFRFPELQRVIEVMGHCRSRALGHLTTLPGALHTVASQHISTLHNTSGMHILGVEHAQVKHSLSMSLFSALP
jgi:hypothetical protein